MIIDQDLTLAFNQKPRVDINSIKKMTPAQLDNLKVYGTAAENLLTNKDLALFIHHFKFDLADELASIKTHTAEDNLKRIAISNQFTGVDKFIASLQTAVWYKNRAVSIQNNAVEE
jgi:hypothetical protein